MTQNATLQKRKRLWKVIVVGLLVIQLVILFIDFLFKSLEFELSNADSHEETMAIFSQLNILVILFLVIQWVIFAFRFIWCKLVPKNAKGSFILFAIAALIPAVQRIVLISISYFDPRFIMPGYVYVTLKWAVFIITFIALAQMRKAAISDKAIKGIKSLYGYCKGYVATAIIGPAICLFGALILFSSFSSNGNSTSNATTEIVGKYFTNGGIEGVVDVVYSKMVLDDSANDASGINLLDIVDGEFISNIMVYGEAEEIVGTLILLIGVCLTVVCFVISTILYYRGWILLAMSNYEDKSEPTNNSPEIGDETVKTDVE